MVSMVSMVSIVSMGEYGGRMIEGCASNDEGSVYECVLYAVYECVLYAVYEVRGARSVVHTVWCYGA
jgi:hypothetical protein